MAKRVSFSQPLGLFAFNRDAWDRRRRYRLHSSGNRCARGHRRGIRNISRRRHGGWTSDLLSSQPRPELRGPLLRLVAVLLYRHIAAPWPLFMYMYSVQFPSYKSHLIYRNKLVLS